MAELTFLCRKVPVCVRCGEPAILGWWCSCRLDDLPSDWQEVWVWYVGGDSWVS